MKIFFKAFTITMLCMILLVAMVAFVTWTIPSVPDAFKILRFSACMGTLIGLFVYFTRPYSKNDKK